MKTIIRTNGLKGHRNDKGYIAKKWCIICKKWAYSSNPMLIPRHQHIGFSQR